MPYAHWYVVFNLAISHQHLYVRFCKKLVGTHIAYAVAGAAMWVEGRTTTTSCCLSYVWENDITSVQAHVTRDNKGQS